MRTGNRFILVGISLARVLRSVLLPSRSPHFVGSHYSLSIPPPPPLTTPRRGGGMVMREWATWRSEQWGGRWVAKRGHGTEWDVKELSGGYEVGECRVNPRWAKDWQMMTRETEEINRVPVVFTHLVPRVLFSSLYAPFSRWSVVRSSRHSTSLSPPSSRYETRNDECNEGSDEASNRHGSGVGGVVHRLRYAGSVTPLPHHIRRVKRPSEKARRPHTPPHISSLTSLPSPLPRHLASFHSVSDAEGTEVRGKEWECEAGKWRGFTH